MSGWINFEIPTKLVGETTESGNEYVKTYRTEILLPKGSRYEGYSFQHPTKLVSDRGNGLTEVTYNDSFMFLLVKKDREPGKKYKRYKLTPSEILAEYETEVDKVKVRLKKKEQKRLAETGRIEVLERGDYYRRVWIVAIRCGEKLFRSSGSRIGANDIRSIRVVADDVSRGKFEAAHYRLESITEEFEIVAELMCIAERFSKKRTGRTASIYQSIDNELNRWLDEFCRQVAEVLEQEGRQ